MKLIDFEIPSREEYETLAWEYMDSLPLEHFVEVEETTHQRNITTMSFALITQARPDIKLKNELLVQYPRSDGRTGSVVPDAMVILGEKPIGSSISFQTAHETAPIFMIFEYVSAKRVNQRKDYVLNRRLYERDLHVPYYFLFEPISKKLTLLYLDNGVYDDVLPNAEGRYAIEEIDLELGIVDGWVRFWFDGKLVPLPDELNTALLASNERVRLEKKRANQERVKAEHERVKAEHERAKAEQERAKAEHERTLAMRETERADCEKARADELTAQLATMMEKLKSLGMEPGA